MALRVTFTNKNYRQQQELQYELLQESMYGKVLKLVKFKTSSTKGISESLEQKSISGQLKKLLAKLLNNKLVEWTAPINFQVNLNFKNSRKNYANRTNFNIAAISRKES